MSRGIVDKDFWIRGSLGTIPLTDKAHCTENVFPEIKLRVLVPNSSINVSVNYLNIPRIGLPRPDVYTTVSMSIKYSTLNRLSRGIVDKDFWIRASLRTIPLKDKAHCTEHVLNWN